MLLKIIFKGIILILSISVFQLKAQENINDTTKLTGKPAIQNGNSQNTLTDSSFLPTNSFFVELLGKNFASVNIDFRPKENFAFSLGITPYTEGFFPSIMGYYFDGERRRLEIGGGMSGLVNSDGLLGIFIHGVIGYRYQQKKVLIFRIGFTPLYGIGFSETGRSMFVPFAGVSFGYSF